MNARRKNPLTRTGILDTALEIASNEGLDALSLRRLGKELGVSATALYGHFESRDRLLMSLVERALQVAKMLPTGDTDQPWQERVEAFYMAGFDSMMSCPPLLQILQRMPPDDFSPGVPEALEYCLKIVADAGLTEQQLVDTYLDLRAFTYGWVMVALHNRGMRDTTDDAKENLRMYQLGFERRDRRRYPLTVELAPHLAKAGSRDQFQRSLRVLIESIATRAAESCDAR